MCRTLALAAALAAFCGVPARAQESSRVVTGYVVDDSTGAPIRAATVSMGSRHVRSDGNGAFRLCEVPTRERTLRAVANGYRVRETAVDSIEEISGIVLRLDVSRPGDPPRIRLIENWAANPREPLMIVDGTRLANSGWSAPDPSRCRPLRPGERRMPDPEEIVSISVLRGEEAVARYGAGARHGAIIIATKAAGSRAP